MGPLPPFPDAGRLIALAAVGVISLTVGFIFAIGWVISHLRWV